MDGARTSSRVRAGVCGLCTDSDTLKHLSQPTHSHPNTAEGTHAGANSGRYKEHFAHQEMSACTQAGAVFSILLQQPSVRAGSAVSWAGSAGRCAAAGADAAPRAGEPGLCTREVSQAGQWQNELAANTECHCLSRGGEAGSLPEMGRFTAAAEGRDGDKDKDSPRSSEHWGEGCATAGVAFGSIHTVSCKLRVLSER